MRPILVSEEGFVNKRPAQNPFAKAQKTVHCLELSYDKSPETKSCCFKIEVAAFFAVVHPAWAITGWCKSTTGSVAGSVTVLCMFQSSAVVSLFLKEPEALELGRWMVKLRVISGPFLGFLYIGSNLLQASGKAVLATLVSALRQGILLIPMLFVMNHFFGVTGNIWAHIVADITAALIAVILAFRQYRTFYP